MLVLQVSDALHRPVSGVRISAAGTLGPPTDIQGQTRIRLVPQIRPWSSVSLFIVPASDDRDLDFADPWNRTVVVHLSEKDTEELVSVVLIPRTLRQLMESGKFLDDSVITSLRKKPKPKQ